MPCICCVPNCKGNYKTGPTVSIYSFPKDDAMKKKWLEAIKREDLVVTKFSRVCGLHFEPHHILREASAVCSKTGRVITAPLSLHRLKKDAVPTIFLPAEKMPPRKKQKKEKGTESTKKQAKLKQNVAEAPIVIKQEPDESENEQPQLAKREVVSMEEFVSSSSIPSSCSVPSSGNSVPSSSTSSISVVPPPSRSPTIPENPFPIANPDSSSVDQTPATKRSSKPGRKRKINDSKLEVKDTPKAIQSKLSRVTKSSKQSKTKRNPRQHTGASKKFAGHSSSPTKKHDNPTREIFESLLDHSDNNPLLGPRTTERSGDLFDVFSDFIADKLREMEWDDCAYALRAILDVVFKAGKGKQDSDVQSNDSSPDTSSEESDQE